MTFIAEAITRALGERINNDTVSTLLTWMGYDAQREIANIRGGARSAEVHGRCRIVPDNEGLSVHLYVSSTHLPTPEERLSEVIEGNGEETSPHVLERGQNYTGRISYSRISSK